MNMATIVPTTLLPEIKGKKYHMALAHLVGVDKTYTDFYKGESENGAFILMDNGVFEGEQQDILTLIERADLIGASELILPDTLFASKATLESTKAALFIVKQQRPELKTMGVPQGTTLAEWVACAREMMHMGVDTIGIPKNLTGIGGNMARYVVLTMLQQNEAEKCLEIEFHLLGCAETPLEIGHIEHAVQHGICPTVRGWDSAIAYVYARDNISIAQEARPAGVVDFKATTEHLDMLRHNIEICEKAGIYREGIATLTV